MFDQLTQLCPLCGRPEDANPVAPPVAIYRPWHVRGRREVKAYVESLSDEVREWLLALYVDAELNLLAVDTIDRGGISGVPVNFPRILWRGHALGAAGFILVHNHPSGDPTASADDIRTTQRLRRTSQDMELPLLDHLIIAGDRIGSVEEF